MDDTNTNQNSSSTCITVQCGALKTIQQILDAVVNKLDEMKSQQSSEANVVYITHKDVQEIFQMKPPTVHKMANTGIIRKYKIGGSVRFKLHEVLSAPTPIEPKSVPYRIRRRNKNQQ